MAFLVLFASRIVFRIVFRRIGLIGCRIGDGDDVPEFSYMSLRHISYAGSLNFFWAFNIF